MCRLSGYYIPQNIKKNSLEAKLNLVNLVTLQESGGLDACGIGFVGNGQLVVHKQPITPSVFMSSPEVTKILDEHNPRAMVVHNRAATLGDKNNPHNNHPNYTKSGLLTIHNGIISNHAELFTKHNLGRDGEVDSEIIVKLVEKYTRTEATTVLAIQKAIKEIQGSIACALLNGQEPDILYLVHRDNNLYIALDRGSGVIYFATEETALRSTLIKLDKLFGFFEYGSNKNKILIQEVPRGFGVKITKDKITKFEVESPPTLICYRPNYESSAYRQKNNIYYSGQTFCRKCNCLWTDQKCKHNINQIKKWATKNPQATTTVFDANRVIKKPSHHTTAELEARLERLFELEVPRPLSPALEIEARRIENTISDRQKQLSIFTPGRR